LLVDARPLEHRQFVRRELRERTVRHVVLEVEIRVDRQLIAFNLRQIWLGGHGSFLIPTIPTDLVVYDDIYGQSKKALMMPADCIVVESRQTSKSSAEGNAVTGSVHDRASGAARPGRLALPAQANRVPHHLRHQKSTRRRLDTGPRGH
jgi:hypothetical protein